jgi:hypothetical protein
MQIKDGISDQLSGTVERHISPAVALKHFHAAFRQFLLRNQDIGCSGIAAQRDHRRVLKEQEDIPDAAFFPHFYESLLQTQAGCVVDEAEL